MSLALISSGLVFDWDDIADLERNPSIQKRTYTLDRGKGKQLDSESGRVGEASPDSSRD